MAGKMEWDQSTLATEIKVMRERYEGQASSDNPSARLQFDFACLLICSPSRSDVREGIELLDQLLEVGFNRTEVLHQLALAHLKIGQYIKAKENVDMWLCLQPGSVMARLLHSLVLDRASTDGLLFFFCLGIVSLGTGFALLRWK
eukprot:TRINITY_DN51369_c0_g1_i1.p1 TRINITY_DN51369_c0_g1~~TRINITY_DN51369_c0_g1_i1.p1  ORF type:complete len:168 (-),score=25.70 TRINITY_DN51369_c0_g1_i1:99-533(-)